MTCDLLDVGCQLSAFASWLIDLLLWVPLQIWSLLLDGLASIAESLPVPGFLERCAPPVEGSCQVGGFILALRDFPPGAVWLSDLFLLRQGLSIVVGASLLRFTIRRIPVIG